MTDPLESIPLAQRRGSWLNSGGVTYEVLLLDGGIDRVGAEMMKHDEIAGVQSDVTAAVLSGKMPISVDRFCLLIELKGTRWVHVLKHSLSDVDFAREVTQQTNLRVALVGYQDTSGATYLRVQQGNNTELHFESCGADYGSAALDDEEAWLNTRFESQHLPDNWWRQFNDEVETQQALLQELDCYDPYLGLATNVGRIELVAAHADAILPENIFRIDLLRFHPLGAQRTEANLALAEAIEQNDLDALQSAIVQGANVQALPGIVDTPMEVILAKYRVDGAVRVAMVKALLAAGADPSATGNRRTAGTLIAASRLADTIPAPTVEIMTCLFEATADHEKARAELLAQGFTAALEAIRRRSLAVVQCLHAHGVPELGELLDYVNRSIDSLRENLGDGTKLARWQEIAAYIESIAAGNVATEFRTQADLEQAQVDEKRKVAEKARSDCHNQPRRKRE